MSYVDDLQELSCVEIHFQCPMCSPSDIVTWSKRGLERHARIAHQLGLGKLYDIAHGKASLIVSKNGTKRAIRSSCDLPKPKKTADSSHWDIVEGSRESNEFPDTKIEPIIESINVRYDSSIAMQPTVVEPGTELRSVESPKSLIDQGELKCRECNVAFCDEAGIIGHMALVHQENVKPYMRKQEVQICKDVFESDLGMSAEALVEKRYPKTKDTFDSLNELSKTMKLNGRQISLLRVCDLKEELAKRNLPKHGKQLQLVLRLTHHLQQNPHECDREGPNGGPNLSVACLEDPSAVAEKQYLDEEPNLVVHKAMNQWKNDEANMIRHDSRPLETTIRMNEYYESMNQYYERFGVKTVQEQICEVKTEIVQFKDGAILGP